MSEIAEIFDEQVAAFNAGDLERFLATYSDDAVVGTFAVDPLVGKAQLRAHYVERFREPVLHCDIDRTEEFDGRWLVAHERITTSAGVSDVLGVFEIIDGTIRRASMLRG